jgi:hypothetical protein
MIGATDSRASGAQPPARLRIDIFLTPRWRRKHGEAEPTVLTPARELRKGTIERVLERSDLELGIQALLGTRSSGRR